MGRRKKRKQMSLYDRVKVKKEKDNSVRQDILLNLTSDIIEQFDNMVDSLGFRSRSEALRFIMRYVIEKYDFLLHECAVIYFIVEYKCGSVAGHDIIGLQEKFDSMRIIDNERVGDCWHMFVRIDSEPASINGIVREFMSCEGIYSFKMLVM